MECTITESNPAERSIESISNIIIHYISKYNNTWFLFHGLSAFCLNTFSINHLENFSACSILFGRSPPDLSNIQVQSSCLTKVPHFHFSDYLDMLNERMSCIRNIVKQHHNETVKKCQLKHGSTSEQLRSFHEGDIVYCDFPSKTIISQMKILSRNFTMFYMGPLYIFAR